MNIVVATDDNFVQHCGVMLISLLENNKVQINVYLLSEGLTVLNNEILRDIVTSRGGEYNYILVDSELLKNCPMPDLSYLSHISIATYYRLLIPNLLPISVSKAIYLDCDIIVRKSIQELWETNIDNYAIGAVYQITSWNVDAIKRLNYPVSYGYFNAGVLLINIDYWRTNNITFLLMDFVRNNLHSIRYHDQDALNAVLYGESYRLPCKWNMQTDFFRKKVLKIVDKENDLIINDYADYKDELLLEMSDPTIIHFVSKLKPWNSKCTHPFRKEYYNYLKKTFWKEFSEPNHYISICYRVCRKITLFLILKGDTYFRTTVRKNRKQKGKPFIQ